MGAYACFLISPQILGVVDSTAGAMEGEESGSGVVRQLHGKLEAKPERQFRRVSHVAAYPVRR